VTTYSVSAVHQQFPANVNVSYRILYDVTPPVLFLSGPRWSISATDASLSSIMRKLWFLAEPVTAAVPRGLQRPAGPPDLTSVMPSLCASDSTSFSNWTPKLLLATRL
jgi:hypothetical protein